MKPFEHGGDVTRFAAERGCGIEEVIDLSSNINFIKPKKNLSHLHLESYPNYDALSLSLSHHFKVLPENMELFNGGSSAIYALFRHLENQTCYLYAPAYLEYKCAALAYNKQLVLINRFEPLPTKLEKNALVIFINPSTPDGTYYDLPELFRVWMAHDATVIVDESFLAFCEKQSALPYLQHYEKLYILSSLTKFYACAGVRVGVVLSNTANIQSLKAKEPLWKISAFDSDFITSILDDRDFKEHTLKENARAKAYLKKILEDSKLCEKIYPSDANFFLVKLASHDAKTLASHLAKHNIMIRDCSNFDFLDTLHVRFAVKSIKDLEHLQKGLACLN
ncbi:aminotransferase class I/II-fold pyridoxal phosphate-dependent enzyme [Sulfurospirillum barnesii]|uniref:PLP-dependent enzyme, histidinol-phosphate/aromatic aminotransferase or cobyric acid decarboxylase n=1 Tax=Sulfurospirillum barnesii (strain ATCC 700032 / DSM 10660 / SES-3) TaxID=760154 RepID=I3XZN7_SULBS|nr:aminotransferase class I/II-fold pyridoxal phosphate-dependent enzyme [Sulfurospirillum barnesii]AFL69411.1 PLP-dependent enzyme, histidinol-phosphate/aromatic aminotransferase or cobyric acid decarboxylase [Sulfurospirillum barnesii SES-3]